MRFCTCKKKTMKKKNSLKFSIFFQIMKFILDGLKTFVSTLCYNNDENCDLFKLYNVLPLKV